jgi:hypothetical protein
MWRQIKELTQPRVMGKSYFVVTCSRRSRRVIGVLFAACWEIRLRFCGHDPHPSPDDDPAPQEVLNMSKGTRNAVTLATEFAREGTD